MKHMKSSADMNNFLANISLMVAKTSVAIYIVKQTPKNVSCYNFVKFLQNQYQKREKEKELLMNFYFIYERQSYRNSDNEINVINNSEIKEIYDYIHHNSYRLKMIKFNLENISIIPTNQIVHQIRYSLREIFFFSTNILIHAFKESSKNGLICSKKMNTYINIKEDVQILFHLWLNKTMIYLKEKPYETIQCFMILKYFIISDIVHVEEDINLWRSTIIQLIQTLSYILNVYLNTSYHCVIIQFINEFINDTLKKLNETFQTFSTQEGKVLFLKASDCTHLIWLLINFLKYFDKQIFNKIQVTKWIKILDRYIEMKQSYGNQMKKSRINQLSILLFIMFVLKGKIIKLTLKV
ncbi:unnamed protein product [Heterobilharzia americana]|nr:unnamed protein product [Heterobilharzia americana]